MSIKRITIHTVDEEHQRQIHARTRKTHNHDIASVPAIALYCRHNSQSAHRRMGDYPISSPPHKAPVYRT